MQIGAWACCPRNMSNGDSLNIDPLAPPGFNGPTDVIVAPDPRVDILIAIVGVIFAKLVELINAHNALVSFAQSLFALQTATTRSVWSIFRAILSDVLHLHFLKALHDITDLVQKIRAWAQKLKGWLDKYKALRRRHDQAVRQLLNLIQRIRRILVPFRILHLKFAQKLDSWLAGVEAKIITHELLLVTKTNEIISALDLVLNPAGYFRWNHTVVSLGQITDSLLRIFTGRGMDWWYTRAPAKVGQNPAPTTATQHYANLRADLKAGAGDVPAWRADLSMWLQTYKAVR